MLGRIVDVVESDGPGDDVVVACVVIVVAAVLGGLFTDASQLFLARAAAPALADLRDLARQNLDAAHETARSVAGGVRGRLTTV